MGKRVLLVEGQDDQHVLWALFKAHSVPESFGVTRPKGDGGIDELFDTIPIHLKASELERLGRS